MKTAVQRWTVIRMDNTQIELAKVIEIYFGADAGYLDIDVFTLARRIMEAGWEKPVRCKDCKNYYQSTIGLPDDCLLHCIDVKPDDFCSYGERRTDE